MAHFNKSFLTTKNIVDYTLPCLHKGKQWYVDFYAYDPSTDSMRRKKYMLDRYKKVSDRNKYATILINNLFEKLKAGWNPWTDATKTRHFTEFGVVLERYRAYIDHAAQKGALKEKTHIDYLSRLRQLEAYLEESNVNMRYAYQFNKMFAVDFLDYLILDKDNSARTRNNYRAWLSAFASWMKERQYIEENPVEEIHMLREEEKMRDALPADALVRLKDYLGKYNPPFYLACLMVYYCFIRPGELRHIKVGDISIEKQTVYVRPDVAKNRKGQYVALNDKVLKMMIEQKVFEHPSQEYLFGRKLIPGEEQVYINQFRHEWRKVRKALHFPDSYQFYSLKDSGIRDLANAEGIVVARDQARHTDISVTNKYLKNANLAHEEAKRFKGEL